MVDYTKFNGPDLLGELGLDGYKWAEAYCQHDSGADIDRAAVWFCNAIMNALDIERGTIINGEHAAYLQAKSKASQSEPTDD